MSLVSVCPEEYSHINLSTGGDHPATGRRGGRDTTTRQIIAFHVGDRSRQSAAQLWANISTASREQATFYTDQYEAYNGVIPAAQHKAIPKKVRKINHIERFNNTLRQRVSRLVRATLAFSKKLENHIGAIRYFICHDNLTRASALLV
jgi:insertion element IS1 protein InsB